MPLWYEIDEDYLPLDCDETSAGSLVKRRPARAMDVVAATDT